MNIVFIETESFSKKLLLKFYARKYQLDPRDTSYYHQPNDELFSDNDIIYFSNYFCNYALGYAKGFKYKPIPFIKSANSNLLLFGYLNEKYFFNQYDDENQYREQQALLNKQIDESSDQPFVGVIVEESLLDNQILNHLEIINIKITKAQNPDDCWHIYTVSVSKNDISKIQTKLKKGTWYMHFWNNKHIIVVFPKKTFEFNVQDPSSWQPAIEYGLDLKIPLEQLDFSPQ